MNVAGRIDRRRRVPHCRVDRDEIGAGFRKPARRLDRRGVGDAGRLENLRPPAYPLEKELQRHRRRGATRLAEHYVIGALFTRRHRFVAHPQAACPYDPFGLEALKRLIERLAGACEMHAVRAEPSGEPRVVLDHQRAVPCDGDFEERRENRLDLPLRTRREPDESAGDRRRGEDFGEGVRESAGVRARERRRHQIK